MTPKKDARSCAAAVAAGALLLLTAAAYAQSSDQEFAGSLAAVSAEAAASAAAQKASPAAQAPAASAIPELLARAQPDFSYTPGHLCSPTDPNFKEYRYPERIPYCNRNVTTQMKQTIGAHYGIAQSQWSGYEFDHLIPLSLGGDSSIDNLWPEPNADNQGPSGKDKLEEQLYLQIRDGKVTQADAVQQIYDWFKASAMAADAVKMAAR